MFLWVSLVLSSLEEASCLQELEELVDRLPRDLEELYVFLGCMSRPTKANFLFKLCSSS